MIILTICGYTIAIAFTLLVIAFFGKGIMALIKWSRDEDEAYG